MAREALKSGKRRYVTSDSIMDAIMYVSEQTWEVATALETLEGKVNRLLGLTLTEHQKDNQMANSLDAIKREITENADATDSAVTLLNSLAEQIRNSADDEQALEKLADDLDANSKRLAAAVLANTPHKPSGM